MIKRPNLFAPGIAQAAAEACWPAISAYLREGGDTDTERDRDSILKQVASAIEFEDDPYCATRNLDRAGWYADAALVDLMEEVLDQRATEHDKAIAVWAAEHAGPPAFGVGDKVKLVRSSREEVTGEVIAVDVESATYTVFCESLGHVRKGLGTHGLIVYFDQVTACPPAE